MTFPDHPHFRRVVFHLVEDLRHRSDACPATLPALGCLESAAETAADLIEAYAHGIGWVYASSKAARDTEFYQKSLADLREIQIDLEMRSLAILRPGLLDVGRDTVGGEADQ